MTSMAMDMGTSEGVKSIFNKYARQYNQARRKLIPCFDDFYSIAVEAVPFQKGEKIKVLDLGAGTGLLSFFVGSIFAKAEVTLVDVSENMLAEAAKTLAGLPNKFNYWLADYSLAEFSQKYDVVISALSIHHLTEEQKKELFHKIYGCLNAGGVFINADQVQGESALIDKCYRETWIKQVQANGVTEEEMAAAFARMKEDKMSTLKSQLQWLAEAGFTEVNCWYKNYSFVVFGGRKGLE